MDEATLEKLRTWAVLARTYTGSPTPLVSPSDLEPDGRKRGRAVREAIEAGLIEPAHLPPNDSGYRLTPGLYESIPAAPFDPIAYWDSQDDPARGDPLHPFIRIGRFDPRLPLSAIKGLLDDPAVRWHLIDERASYYHREPGPAERIGPLTAAEVPDRLARIGRPDRWEAVATTAALEAHVARVKLRRDVDRAEREHLPWGLVTLGLLAEEDADRLPAGLTPVRSSLGGGRDDGPIEWAGRLRKGVESARAEINRLEAALSVLDRLGRAVAEYGGWDKFRADYRARLEEELTKGTDA
jgi:hypothetical protein